MTEASNAQMSSKTAKTPKSFPEKEKSENDWLAWEYYALWELQAKMSTNSPRYMRSF